MAAATGCGWTRTSSRRTFCASRSRISAELIQRLLGARWFGGKNRPIQSASVIDRAEWLSVVEVTYQDGGSELYVDTLNLDPPAVLGDFAGSSQLHTAQRGVLRFVSTHVLGQVTQPTQPISLMHGEQSNTSIRYGDAFILKLFRRVQFGQQPDVEIGRFLTESTDFRGTPAVAGSLEYTAPDGRTAALALLQRFQPNRGDAWRATLNRLRTVLFESTDPVSAAHCMRTLGETTAALHVALASGASGSTFSPEPIEPDECAYWRDAIAVEVQQAAAAVAERETSLDVARLLGRTEGILALAGSCKIRHHGDYHLGQVLECEDGAFAIIDFEGEPAKPLELRREKRSPLRDVAGMLRSFDYARHAALRASEGAIPLHKQLAETWYVAARSAFVDGYVHTLQRQRAELLPRERSEIDRALGALELEKAAYEVLYELNNRPDWVAIPLAALAAE